jgi:hypothetical protein
VDSVVAVSVEVSADVLLIVTEDEERLHVVGLVALEGVVVTEHVSATVPVNESVGVTVMVELFPVVAPGLTVMLPLLVRVKLLLEFSQKSPQPLMSGAATSNNFANFPIFIAAPSMLFSGACRLQKPANRVLPWRAFCAAVRLCMPVAPRSE